MADVPPGVKGMNDILPPEMWKWRFLEEKAREVLESFAYRELRTPVLEYTSLFIRSVGEVTDVVEKQMYTFDDRDGKSVSLRPEGTASAVRTYVDHSQWNVEPVTRWYYVGPMFRHERAQRGRLRQFHQIGAEFFGPAEPTADAEMIAMLVAMFEAFGLPTEAIDVHINSLGDPEERQAYREALVKYYTPHRDKLDEDSRRRLETNPLRILDSKYPDVVALNENAPTLIDTLGDASKARFAEVRGTPRRPGRAEQPRPAARARARLLHGDDLRAQDHRRRARHPEHHRRRRALRPAGRLARRQGDARDRVRAGRRARAARDAGGGRERSSPRWRPSSRRWTPPPSPRPCPWRTGCARTASAWRSSTAPAR